MPTVAPSVQVTSKARVVEYDQLEERWIEGTRHTPAADTQSRPTGDYTAIISGFAL
ncbi:MAG: hypothetical protein U1D30_07010 [Planctomycetota bacterium]